MNNQLYKQWDDCWKNNKNHNLTFIGKKMLLAKQKALKDVLKTIKPTRAIDVGCGLGFMLAIFKQQGIECIGIDVSSTAIRVCQEKGLKAQQQKLEDLEGQYDFVFSDGLLEHFLNFEPYAKHLMRLSNRYVAIIQTDHQSFLGKTSIYFAELLRGKKNIWEYNYKIQDFVDIFEKHGFKLKTETEIFSKVFRLLVFQKM